MNKLEKYEIISPFKLCVIENFPFIEADFDAITNYQLLCKVVDYLNKLLKNQNLLQENEKNLSIAFNNLKNYVDNYFKNLDITEEVDAKLDEMAENGTLAEIINEQLFDALNEKMESLPSDVLDLQHIVSQSFDDTELFNGYSHTYLQGFTYVENNRVVMALVNQEGSDDYARVVEFDLNTKSIIRSSYMIVNHANSLSYDKDNRVIYVAHCNRGENATPDNRISVINYDTFSVVLTTELTNLPIGNRVRSVWYDNDSKKFYCGDITTLFEVDTTTWTIINTLELDKTYIDENITNQTIKTLKDWIITFNVNYIGIFNKECKLVKIINLKNVINYTNITEYEDCGFDENNNIIVGVVYRENSSYTNRYAGFYKGNLFYNANSEALNLFVGAYSSAYNLYVDNTSTEVKEDGTSAYPFKSLQKALSVLQNINHFSIVNIYGTEYDEVYVQSVKASLNFMTNCHVKGLRFVHCPVIRIVSENDSTPTIDGMTCMASNVWLDCDANAKFTFNYNEEYSNTIKAIQNSSIYLHNVILNGNNTNPVFMANGSSARLFQCTFNGYEGTYAINCINASNVYTCENVYNIPASTTQRIYRVAGGSYLNKGNGQDSLNIIDLESQGQVFSSTLWYPNVDGDGYTGDIKNPIDYHFNTIVIGFRIPSTTGHKKYVEIPKYNGAYTFDVEWVNNTTIYKGNVSIQVTGNRVSIEYNRLYVFTKSSGTWNYYSADVDLESQGNRFAQVIEVGVCTK